MKFFLFAPNSAETAAFYELPHKKIRFKFNVLRIVSTILKHFIQIHLDIQILGINPF